MPPKKTRSTIKNARANTTTAYTTRRNRLAVRSDIHDVSGGCQLSALTGHPAAEASAAVQPEAEKGIRAAATSSFDLAATERDEPRDECQCARDCDRCRQPREGCTVRRVLRRHRYE
jgi:hypothetical protein